MTSKLRIKFGNYKLPDTTGIISMGPATTCPSKKKNLCKVTKKGIRCYALKAEQMYQHARLYREEQEKYWKKTSARDIRKAIQEKIKHRRKPTKCIRFNETGDFHTQKDVDKLSTIAKGLKESLNIVTYGYTARSDLNFTGVNFLVKGSGFSCNNGKTIVINKNEKVPLGFFLCPASCKSCDICCKNTKTNLAFRKH